MRFCMKCGKPLTEGALFCMNCGAPQKGSSNIPDIPVPAEVRQEAGFEPAAPAPQAPEMPAWETASEEAMEMTQADLHEEPAAMPVWTPAAEEAAAEPEPAPEPVPVIPEPEPSPDASVQAASQMLAEAFGQQEAAPFAQQAAPQPEPAPFGQANTWKQPEPFGAQAGGWNANAAGGAAAGAAFGTDFRNPQYQAAPAQGAPYQNAQYGQTMPAYNPYDHTSEFDAKDISDNKVICMLLYLTGILGLFIALLSQKSEYVSFHIRQSLKLTVLELLLPIAAGLCTIVFGLLAAIFRAPGIALIPAVLAGIVLVVFFVVRIMMFFKICAGKAEEAPIARKFSFLR